MIAYSGTISNNAYYGQTPITAVYSNNYWPPPSVPLPSVPLPKKKVYDWAKLAAVPIPPPCEPPVLAVLPRRAPRPQARQRDHVPMRSRPGMKGRV